jgi:glutathione S-transferase
MKLYFAPAACSLAVHIVAREAGIDVDTVKVDLTTHRLDDGTDYHAVNPRGYVPALVLDDGTLLTEVAALLPYLGDLKPEANLLPPAGTLERVQLQGWLSFVSSELHKVFSPWLWHKDTAASTRRSVTERIAVRFAELDRRLATQPYLMGQSFSVADAYAFTIVNWSHITGISLKPYPSLAAYQDRIAARPAVIAALRAEGLLKQAA